MFSREYLLEKKAEYERAESEHLDIAKLNHGAALAIQNLLDEYDAATKTEGEKSPSPVAEEGID